VKQAADSHLYAAREKHEGVVRLQQQRLELQRSAHIRNAR
jgi:hypothetical protein